MSNYGLGRRYSEDQRDLQYLMSPPVPEPWQEHRFWWAPPPMDQGSTPQCVGYAWHVRIKALPTFVRNPPPPHEIYHAAQKVDAWPGEDYDGTSVRAGAKVLQQLGHLDTYTWAYDAETVRRYVLTTGTVVLGTIWTTAMFNPVNGILDPRSGSNVGGHAYLVVGYSGRRGAFRILNSWGAGWAEGGRAWLTGEDLDYLLQQYGEACAPTEPQIPHI